MSKSFHKIKDFLTFFSLSCTGFTMLMWFSILFLLPVAAIIVFQVLTYTLFLIVNARSGQLYALQDLHDGKLYRSLAQAFANSIIGTFLLLPLYVFRKKRGLVCPGQLPAQGPIVVYVHGLYHNASAWTLFKIRMSRLGLPHHCFWSYSSFTGDFFALQNQLKKDLDELALRHSGCTFVLIGHSLGGLLLKTVAPCLQNVQDGILITIATPHKGSVLARLGLSRLSRSLVPDSPIFTSGVGAASPDPDNLARFSLYSSIDNMVLPADACRVDHNDWTEINLGPLGHVAPLFTARTPKLCLSLIQK